jgi:hypothetical protein
MLLGRSSAMMFTPPSLSSVPEKDQRTASPGLGSNRCSKSNLND